LFIAGTKCAGVQLKDSVTST